MTTKADIQYIFDELGNKTAVIIPISIWESILQSNKDKYYPSGNNKIEFLFGVLKDSPILKDIEDYSQEIRKGAIERV